MITVTDRDGVTVAACPCGTMSVLVDAGQITAEMTRAAVLELVDHARTCAAADERHAVLRRLNRCLPPSST